METNQKYALITGATSGIGFELAKLFAHNNYNLVIVARSQEELDMTAIELEILFGADVIKIAKDLFKPEDAFALCEEIRANGISIDVLVNDTGYCVYSEFDGAGIERELDIINLNICATVILTKHFVKEMLTRGKGKILNLGSVAGNLPDAWQAVSRASEAFMLSYTTLVRKELKDTGVTLTTLTPGVKSANSFNKGSMNESKAVRNKETVVNLANVAWDGFKALMAGKEQVISAYL
jgi:short-subunit dehydrogenase